MNTMNRFAWTLVCILFLALVPSQAFAMNSMETTTVTISFFSIGLGTFALTQHGWAIGALQITIGVVGLVLTAAGLMKGGLLEKALD